MRVKNKIQTKYKLNNMIFSLFLFCEHMIHYTTQDIQYTHTYAQPERQDKYNNMRTRNSRV